MRIFLPLFFYFLSGRPLEAQAPNSQQIREWYEYRDGEKLKMAKEICDPQSEEGRFLSALFEPDATRAALNWERFLTSHPGSKLEPIALERLYFYYHLKGDSITANRFYKLLLQRHPSYKFPSIIPQIKGVSQQGRAYNSSPSSHKRTLWTIQVGAFRDRAAAEKFARSLTPYGVVFTSPEPNSERQPLIRVELGRFETKEEAEKVAQKLEAERNIKGWVKPVIISKP